MAVGQGAGTPLQLEEGPGELCFSLDQGLVLALQAGGRAGGCTGKGLLTMPGRYPSEG